MLLKILSTLFTIHYIVISKSVLGHLMRARYGRTPSIFLLGGGCSPVLVGLLGKRGVHYWKDGTKHEHQLQQEVIAGLQMIFHLVYNGLKAVIT
jgi:hypothetical protein